MNTSHARTAYVTGGTGFVGHQLCVELLAQGWTVTALARQPQAAPELSALGVRLVAGDLLEPATLTIPAGTDTVFHVAGDTSLWHKRDALQTRINVDGTRHLLAAARSAGTRRVVVTSTVSAYGHQTQRFDERTPSVAARSSINYERSKWQAEELARRAAADGLDTVILQPAAIIGPRDSKNWGRMFLLLQGGQLPLLPPGRLSFKHVREIARAHVAAATQGRAGESYVLGGHHTDLAEMARGACALLGRRAPRIVAPAAVLSLFGSLLGTLTPASRAEPLMTREMAHLMSATTVCSSAKAERELGFRSTGLAECLADCHAWLRQAGLL
jgi:nucleoside-diphosphate-sugar epimerase